MEPAFRWIRILMHRFPAAGVARWLIVGGLLAACNLSLLYFFVSECGLPVSIASAVTFGLASMIRYLANNKLVFHKRFFDFERILPYYLSTAGASLIWYVLTNVFNELGIHYLFAAILATSCSALFNLLTNFLWVWKSKSETLEIA
jgi:putative flippase GtrA